jgi:hypothetical protein
MPIQKCTNKGKSGYRWGQQGHCYTGPGARAKALRQGRAIEVNKGRAEAYLAMIDLLYDSEADEEDIDILVSELNLSAVEIWALEERRKKSKEENNGKNQDTSDTN